MRRATFRDQGDAKLERLTQDASNRACSESQGAALDEKLANAIEAASLQTVKFPADGKPIVDYTWGKLWNAKAYNACSDMPRFSHAGILSEAQLRDVMALLLDPKSPVNQ